MFLNTDILVVGAGHAGAQVAIALRQAKFEGSITLIGDESDFPYERPPLSKDYLSGDKPFERILIRPPSFWQERGITMRLGERVTSVDPDAHRVMTETDAEISYGTLVWATGGAARRLSCAGHDFAGVHGVRTRADVDRLIAELPEVSRIVVIGGGYIGLEAAAVLVKSGKSVVLLEALDRVLARVAGPDLSNFYAEQHRANGVDLRFSIAVESILGEDRRVTGVRLMDGHIVPADMVIVGIGIVPAVAELLDAGAEGGNGVKVDAQCRTSIRDIFAIGDCALHCNRYADGAAIRLESVQNANDQANVVAHTIMGRPVAYNAVPWFWSNQYDLKLQTVGLSIGHDEAILRGDPAERSFSIVYTRAGRVVAIDCVNAVKDYVQGRRLVVEGAVIDRALLANGAIPLKDILTHEQQRS